ncbi:hypothetical protein KGQ19_13745 [Catenulispora sp. NL8]|uniref:Uncharacterized protein n=1 Tax=Catenulispora pinistramenti TaxID=2705254 RepID=A0ABS5KPE4_9ACTN|nr:hypothetical protein [Catenulispora pinistramenti]MBS2547928.1 hypothetical protein [Catenulispora pinistramenti]
MYRRALSAISAGTVLTLAVVLPGSAAGAAGSTPPPVASSQDPSAGPPFVGGPAEPHPLPANSPFYPQVSGMHGDGGNTNTSRYAGPTGTRPVTGSAAVPLSPLLWDSAGRLTAGYVNTASGTPVNAVAAVDPTTLAVTAEWDAPAGQTLNFGYLYQNAGDQVLVSSRQGHIYLIQRRDGSGGTTFDLVRDVDLVADGVLGPGQSLLNAAFDAAGNIWFTTGGIIGIGQNAGTSTIVGYLPPSGAPHTVDLPNQAEENGIAVSGTTAYVVTGPVAGDTANATGTMYAFAPGGGTAVTTVWNQDYQAGDGVKPGGFARGSGATPTLLGDSYVAITDNADNQINLLVYRQGAAGNGESQLVCGTPLFSAGASANDVGLVGEDQGGRYSVIVQNDFDAPQFQAAPSDVNGAFNNMDQMAPGVEKLAVPGAGGTCPKQWTAPVRVKSVPVLSTATGLLYGYTQDPSLAADGTYVWYFTALDYCTGAVVWRVRAGGGGSYNDDYKAATLGPDGTLYQGILGGVATLRDGS